MSSVVKPAQITTIALPHLGMFTPTLCAMFATILGKTILTIHVNLGPSLVAEVDFSRKKVSKMAGMATDTWQKLVEKVGKLPPAPLDIYCDDTCTHIHASIDFIHGAICRICLKTWGLHSGHSCRDDKRGSFLIYQSMENRWDGE